MDVKKPDRTALKSYFVKNAVPTESNFADLVEAMINQKEDGIAKLAGEPLSIQADGSDASLKKAINFYKNFADPKPAWTLSLNPRVDPNNPATAKPGWSIGDAEGNSKLFIDQTTGNLGVGTTTPGEALEVSGRAKAGPLTIGPWPAGAAYGFVGTNALNQAAAGNYALLQGTTDGPGRTFLNSPVDIRFRINNADQMVLLNNGNVGIGTSAPAGKLHVQTGGAGTWDKFVVKTTTLWGDGPNNPYVTIGEGGAAGIMFYNPHVVWFPPEGRASIRMGRSGGVSTGHYWDIGVRAGNVFSILDAQNGAFGLSINEIGTVKINVLQLGEKWRLSGVGDHEANDKWLRLMNVANTAYFGGFAAFELWSNGGVLQGSDLRLKKDVSPLADARENILKLRGVQFKWRDGAEHEPFAMGLIAQEVEEVFPEVVGIGPDGMKGINYSALIAPVIEVMKQQQAQIAELQAEVQALRANG